jgi:hypothetical protein
MPTSNMFSSMLPDFKESYANEKKRKFKRLHSIIKGKKATAELEASKNPMKWEKAHREMSIKALKGIAF